MEIIKNLLTIRGIMAIVMTFGFIYLAIAGLLSTEYITVYTVCISYYFGSSIKDNRKESDNGTKL